MMMLTGAVRVFSRLPGLMQGSSRARASTDCNNTYRVGCVFIEVAPILAMS